MGAKQGHCGANAAPKRAIDLDGFISVCCNLMINNVFFELLHSGKTWHGDCMAIHGNHNDVVANNSIR